MSKARRNQLKALVIMAAVSVAAASTASGQGYAGPVVTPSSLDFGSVLAGSSSTVQTVTVSVPPTEGFPGLSIVSIAFPTGYVRNGGSCPSSGAAPIPCTIGVQFVPTALGTQAGNMVVTASLNGGPGVGANVALTGIATQGAAASAPTMGSWGLGLLLASIMGIGMVFVRKR